MTQKYSGVVAGAMLAAALATGCALAADEDGERFRQAIPQPETVAVAGPENAGEGSTTASIRAAAETPWDSGPYAVYYAFTRHVRDGVNAVTAGVLGAVWVIVHTQPTSVSDNQAVWGPHTDALEPATWQFRVVEVADDVYEYSLEGRPKNSSDAFQTVLSGLGYGRAHPSHGDGHFEIDLDVAHALDPLAWADGSGSVTITHDLPRTISEDLFSGARAITAEVQPTAQQASWSATSLRSEDGSGMLLVTAEGDLDEDAATAAEQVQIASQWQQDGAGRADIALSGGEVPADIGEVSAVECWGADFYRTYYADSVDYAPIEGEAGACVFADPVDAS